MRPDKAVAKDYVFKGSRLAFVTTQAAPKGLSQRSLIGSASRKPRPVGGELHYMRHDSGLIKSTGTDDELRTPEATLPMIIFFSPV